MENNNNVNCEILQTPVQQKRPKTLGIRYSTIKTISKTPYSETKRRDNSIKKQTEETASPRTPFSISDNNIEKTSKSTGHLPNYNKLSLGRKVLRKKRLQFVDTCSSDLKTNVTEEDIDKSSSKVDKIPIHVTRQTRKKLRIDSEANTENNTQSGYMKNTDTTDTRNLKIKNDKKELKTLPIKDEKTFQINFSESNSMVKCTKSEEKSSTMEVNFKEKTASSQQVEHTECNSSPTKVNSNNALDNFFDESEDFPVDIIEDENHIGKVAELQRLISIWKEGFKRALDDLSKKLDPPREKIEILELLNIPGHMINYI